jgi:hypothetical protein
MKPDFEAPSKDPLEDRHDVIIRIHEQSVIIERKIHNTEFLVPVGDFINNMSRRTAPEPRVQQSRSAVGATKGTALTGEDGNVRNMGLKVKSWVGVAVELIR